MRFSVNDIFFARTICRYNWKKSLKQTLSQKDCSKSFFFFLPTFAVKGYIQQELNTLINNESELHLYITKKHSS